MTAVKRKQKVSLSLDADLIQELKAGGPLSPQVNEAIRARLGRPAPAPATAPEGSTEPAEPTEPTEPTPEELAPAGAPPASPTDLPAPGSGGAHD